MNAFAIQHPLINQITQTDVVYNAAGFLDMAKNCIASRRSHALNNPEFDPLFSGFEIDLHTIVSNEHLCHIANAVVRTIDHFQAATRDMSIQVRGSNIVVFEHNPDLSLDTKVYHAITSTAHATQRLGMMESFLTDLITYDTSPLRLLNICPETSFDATSRKYRQEVIKECTKLIRAAVENFVPATERSYDELLNMASTVRAHNLPTAKTSLDTLSLARSHVKIGSALTMLEVGLFGLNYAPLQTLTKHLM